MSLPLDKNVYFYCTCGPGSKCSSTKNALSTFLDGITPVLFKYPSHNKALHFKASSTYFLLGRPEMGHLFLRCFLSPNGKGRTDCIPLRFRPSLHKRRLLVLRSENGSSETCPPTPFLVPTTYACECFFCTSLSATYVLQLQEKHFGCGSFPFFSFIAVQSDDKR